MPRATDETNRALREAGTHFYNMTALWWGTSAVTETDRRRADFVGRHTPPFKVIELGAGFGGTAAATADLGNDVVAVERSPYRATLARRHEATPRSGSLVVVETDFFSWAPKWRVDRVTYWSGFGLGDDHDQRLLLERIGGWLLPEGRALIDVFDPHRWKRYAGQRRTVGDFSQQIDFDETHQRLRVSWWPEARPDRTVREEIQCYDISRLTSLVRCSGLAVKAVLPSISRHAESTSTYLVELAGE